MKKGSPWKLRIQIPTMESSKRNNWRIWLKYSMRLFKHPNAFHPKGVCLQQEALLPIEGLRRLTRSRSIKEEIV
jgi:hypothetical protein